MSRTEVIKQKLSVLNPHILEITDDSAKHAGHSGNLSDKGETHFAIQIAAEELKNLNKVKQHRIINNLLKSEFETGLHALSIKVL